MRARKLLVFWLQIPKMDGVHFWQMSLLQSIGWVLTPSMENRIYTAQMPPSLAWHIQLKAMPTQLAHWKPLQGQNVHRTPLTPRSSCCFLLAWLLVSAMLKTM